MTKPRHNKTETGEAVSPIELKFESQLKALDARKPEFLANVKRLTLEHETRLEIWATLAEIFELPSDEVPSCVNGFKLAQKIKEAIERYVVENH